MRNDREPDGRPGTGLPVSRRTLITGASVIAAGAAVAGWPTARAAAGTLPRPSAERPGAGGPGANTPGPQAVTFDQYSLSVGGERMFVFSGEFHPFRLPSPSLWRDILQKMKSNGYSAVCSYFNWSYHSPAPGTYDFTGVRDMDRYLDMAAETGLYVLARPGPYINGELNGGGFPGWLLSRPGHGRTDESGYLDYALEWMHEINSVLARHQVTDGSGTVLLYQIENEYAAFLTSSTGIDYMSALYTQARNDGITVPIYHNDKGRNGDWVPGSFPAPDTNYLYAFDGYPSASGTPVDWGYFGSGGKTGGSTASPATPGFMAEFGGGWFDPWGGAPWDGAGYAYERALDDATYERTFYLTNVANGIKIHNVYMTFGGTSWGWLPAPIVYTSYDYGAAIDESRQLTSKIPAMKEVGYLLSSVPDITKLDPDTPVTPSNSLVKAYHLSNPDTQAHFFFLRNDHYTQDLTFTVPISTPAGDYTIPQNGTVELDTKDIKVVVANYQLESGLLVYSTSQLMTHAPLVSQGGAVRRGAPLDVAVFVSRPGEAGETVLRYPAGAASSGNMAPSVRALSGAAPVTSWDASTGDLLLDYTHSGIGEILVTPPGRSANPLLLIIVDDESAASLWRLDTPSGAVIVYGPELLRTVSVEGASLRLSGDTTTQAPLRAWAARPVGELSWNGTGRRCSPAADGGYAASGSLAAPPPLRLPELNRWRSSPENPEAQPGFDDSAWTVADNTTSNSVTPVPAGQSVLFVDDYGFHYGDVWYRGSWSGTAGVTGVNITYQSGQAGMLLAWLDGQYLGSHQMPIPASAQDTTQGWSATVTLPVPATDDGDHVLAVLVRSMSHQEDGGVNDAGKTALGLTGVTFTGATPAIAWKIQGDLGGESIPDPVRGALNTGGLYGERNGWHLPGFPDERWATVALPYADPSPGVAWYRTTFTLSVPSGTDASLGLVIADAAPQSYRALIFVNGWNLGQYVSGVGPQTTFVLPNGILNPRGENTLALAVTSGGLPAGGTSTAAQVDGGLGAVSLTVLGTALGGVPVEQVYSPGYAGRR
ncbi:MAG: beta-galactosidase [Trebonia sp.]